MSPSPPPFLLQHLPISSHSAHHPTNPDLSADHQPTTNRPHITVTWAQSLDAKIAGVGGERVILSGPESMEMTHWMRTMHDAILVGINTIILDDPRLQIQLVPNDPSLLPPQPLILDPQLRFPLTARILSAWTLFNSSSNSNSQADIKSQALSRPTTIVRQPWVICDDQVDPKRQKKAKDAGVRVIPVPLDSKGHIPPCSLPDILTSLNLHSVMIEGGSNILGSFLTAPSRSDGSILVDSVVVTVAPMFIGEGISIVPNDCGDALPNLKTVHTETMGKDAVMVCTIQQ